MPNVKLVGRSNPTVPTPNEDTNDAGSAEAFPYVANASGSANKLWINLPSANVAEDIVLAIYSDNGETTHPDALLGSAVVNNFAVDGDWATADLAESVEIVADTPYWLVVLSTDDTVTFLDQAASVEVPPVSETSDETDLTDVPSSWTSGPSWPTANACLWASESS